MAPPTASLAVSLVSVLKAAAGIAVNKPAAASAAPRVLKRIRPADRFKGCIIRDLRGLRCHRSLPLARQLTKQDSFRVKNFSTKAMGCVFYPLELTESLTPTVRNFEQVWGDDKSARWAAEQYSPCARLSPPWSRRQRPSPRPRHHLQNFRPNRSTAPPAAMPGRCCSPADAQYSYSIGHERTLGPFPDN